MRCILKTFPVFLSSIREGWPPGFLSTSNYACAAFDGEYRLFDTRVVPTRDVSGRIERWYNLLMDIEDRSRAAGAIGADGDRISPT